MLKFIAMISFIVLTACVSSNETSREAPSVYIFNGLFGTNPSIGYGMRNLAGKINGSTLKPHGANPTEQIIKDFRNGKIRGVVLIGHSLGAVRAVRIAQDLKRQQINIRYLALIDPPINLDAPRNVKCDLFRQWEKGSVKNCREVKNNATNHIQIGNDSDVHRRILLNIRRGSS